MVANFQPRDARQSFNYLHQRRGPKAGYDWEKSLYHQIQAASAVAMLSASTQSPVQGKVTDNDAISTCYVLIGNQHDLVERTLSCCTSSTDQVFLAKLFEFLLDGNKDWLLSIDSPDLERWMKTRQDAHLLLHLNFYLKDNDAGELALGIASDSMSRIEWLDRANYSL